MKVVCINSGSTKNLTEDNSYEIVEENNTFYYVINDKGVTTRYNKKLFKPEEEMLVEETKSVIRDIVLTSDNFSFEGNLECGINKGILKLNINNYINETSEPLFNIANCDYSCGILEINGFNQLVYYFNKFINYSIAEGINHNLNIIIHNRFMLFQTIFENLINELFEENHNKGIILMSSNITDNNSLDELCNTVDSDDIFEKVDTLFTNSTYTENPNSGNMIFLGVSVR